MSSTPIFGIEVDVDRALITNLQTNGPWPNVITIHDAWEEKEGQYERLFIRMDLKGATLAECLQKGWRFAGAYWFDVMTGIVNGLLQPGLENITHGDLKPANSERDYLEC